MVTVSHCTIITNSKNYINHSNIPRRSITFLSIFFIALILGIFSVTEIHVINPVKGEISQIFRVTVGVTNTGNSEEYGTVYVNVHESQAVDGLGGQIFPAGETVYFEFIFDSKEIPIGKEFAAEVVYGDDIHKRVYGKNTSPSFSETININIP